MLILEIRMFYLEIRMTTLDKVMLALEIRMSYPEIRVLNLEDFKSINQNVGSRNKTTNLEIRMLNLDIIVSASL